MRNTVQARRNVNASSIIQQPKSPAEFKIVRLRECPVDSAIIDNPRSMVKFWRDHVPSAEWFKEDKECLCVFLLNTRKRLIGFELVSQGTLDTVVAHPRELLRLAAIKNAAGFIMAHNHPSGDPTPSGADIKLTRDLLRAAQMMQIELVDHIIIGDARRERNSVSLRELGYFNLVEPKSHKRIADIMDCAEKVNEAALQSDVLLELIENHLDHREHRSGIDWTGELAENFNHGLSLLCQNTRERLKKAAADIMATAYEKEEVAA